MISQCLLTLFLQNLISAKIIFFKECLTHFFTLISFFYCSPSKKYIKERIGKRFATFFYFFVYMFDMYMYVYDYLLK